MLLQTLIAVTRTSNLKPINLHPASLISPTSTKSQHQSPTVDHANPCLICLDPLPRCFVCYTRAQTVSDSLVGWTLSGFVFIFWSFDEMSRCAERPCTDLRACCAASSKMLDTDSFNMGIMFSYYIPLKKIVERK